MPKISVIVPVYNVEKYLNRCIDSILDQTFTDFELILVDDGATDDSNKICDEYAIKDSRIKVIHKGNGGLSSARNAGIDSSTGNYLTFIDSDDWVAGDYLKVLYENLIAFDADISAVNYHKEYDDYSAPCPKLKKGLFKGKDSLSYLYDPDMSIYVNIACSKLYKKNLFDNIRYPIGKLHEDGFTTYKLLFRSKTVYFSDEDLYYYYQRDDSIMNTNFNIKKIDEYFVYVERSDFFCENDLTCLFSINAMTRLACIKSLTIKIFANNVCKKKRCKYLKLFKEDIKNNFIRAKPDLTFHTRFSNILYCLCPKLFYYIHIFKSKIKLFLEE